MNPEQYPQPPSSRPPSVPLPANENLPNEDVELREKREAEEKARGEKYAEQKETSDTFLARLDENERVAFGQLNYGPGMENPEKMNMTLEEFDNTLMQLNKMSEMRRGKFTEPALISSTHEFPLGKVIVETDKEGAIRYKRAA